MKRQKKTFWAKTVLICSVVPVVIFASASGPELGRSGVPGEQTCANGCHIGTLNPAGGGVTVSFSGGGTNFTPGVKQRLTVTVSDPTMRAWGFQATARQAGSDNARVQAGTFANLDSSTTIGCASTNLVQQTYDVNSCPASQPLMYINHASAKTGSASASWEIDWTPPDMESVTVYVTGNAANGNSANTGDRIYSRTYTLTKSAAGGGGTKPIISANAVTNGASFQPGIAAGSWVTIKGTNLASNSTGIDWSNSISGGRLPTSLGDVSVAINGKPAYVYFVRNDQINVLAPADTNLGPVNVVVTSNGVASDPVTAQLKTFSPAFFQYNGTWAVATTPDFRIIGDPARVAGTVPAKPGDVIILWGTGFGPTNPAAPDGQVVSGSHAVATNPTVTIGGSGAAFAAGALSPGAAGLYQIVVTVPNVADGDQKVIATAGGESSPDSVTIYVKR